MRTRAPARFALAWLAIFGLFIQLTAAAACAAGSARTDIAAGGGGSFTICHAQSAADATSPAQRQDTPGHHHDHCPFCTVHCHAAGALPPVIGSPAPVATCVGETTQTPLLKGRAVRLCVAASPRGPPARG